MEDNNAAYYYHFDGLGSVVALSNSNGDSCQSYEYSAYGQVAASDPNFIANPYMFTGRRFDIETGLYYYRARYYNPHIGRFMQTDPVGYDDGINWYLYCGNNPLAFVDPSGRFHSDLGAWLGSTADACDLGNDTISAIIDLLTNDSCDLSVSDVFKELGIGFLEGAWDGVQMTILHDSETIEEYGAVGTFSNISGYVGEGALVLASGAVIWQAAGGATMEVAVGTIGENLHFAYGTAGYWLHALGSPGSMTTTFKYAEEFAATAKQLTGIPIISSSGLLFTYGTETYNCATAVWNGFAASGGALLGGTAVGGTTAGFLALEVFLFDEDD